MNSSFFAAIERSMPSLTASQRRIAEQVLADPTVVATSTIIQLAERTGTSQASVARFCRSAGFDGYTDFRIAAASACSREQAARERFKIADAEISTSDPIAQMVTKVAYQEIRAVEATLAELDLGALQMTATAIGAADRIDIFGIGSSGLTALDLQQKLHRTGFCSFCFTDQHLTLASVALSGPGNVAIGISHSGQTVETEQFLDLARTVGATTVAITNAPSSRVGSLADAVLATNAVEPRLRSGAMTSRLAQLAIVDVLLVRLVQMDFDRIEGTLRLTRQSVLGHRRDLRARTGSSSG